MKIDIRKINLARGLVANLEGGHFSILHAYRNEEDVITLTVFVSSEDGETEVTLTKGETFRLDEQVWSVHSIDGDDPFDCIVEFKRID